MYVMLTMLLFKIRAAML